ncbi:MAG: BatA and WFA domain-containing protein, partial [Deltaproteobacteria bacterium]|nr:BatA and WFA domain-containing protein [Deltaproteobacteria bacterium]
MALSLLVPAALALSALVILPLIAHMARQTPRERRPFGAMLLLERVVKRLRRRRRVKDWFLLLLRILALLAVVFGAAGLRWSYTGGVPEFGGSGRVVVIVDRSMSMSLSDEGTTLLARARSGAIQLVRELPAGTLVGAVVFGNEADRLAPSLTTDHERVIAALEEVQPGGGTSNLRAALLEARLLLGGEVGEVLVFSDEAGPRMVAEATGELKRLVEAGSAVIPRPVKGNPPRNVAVISAVYGDGIEGGQVTLRMANFGPDPVEVACEVVLPDGAEIPIFVDLPPEGEGEERITVPPEALGGVGRATCEDPDLHPGALRGLLPRAGARALGWPAYRSAPRRGHPRGACGPRPGDPPGGVPHQRCRPPAGRPPPHRVRPQGWKPGDQRWGQRHRGAVQCGAGHHPSRGGAKAAVPGRSGRGGHPARTSGRRARAVQALLPGGARGVRSGSVHAGTHLRALPGDRRSADPGPVCRGNARPGGAAGGQRERAGVDQHGGPRVEQSPPPGGVHAPGPGPGHLLGGRGRGRHRAVRRHGRGTRGGAAA